MSGMAGAAPGREALGAQYRAGCAAQAAGRHGEAAEAFAASLEMAPDFADAALNLGCCLYGLKRFGEAAAACEVAVRLRPDAAAHFNLGMARLAEGNAAGATAPLRAAVRLAPGLARHPRTLGLALALAEQGAEAVAALAAGVADHPADAAMLTMLAGLLIEQGRPEAAVGAALRAVDADPASGAAQGHLALALHRLGRSARALGPAQAAVRLLPADAGSAATMGAVLYGCGAYEAALAESRRALGLQPGLWQAQANEALALEALGVLGEAQAAARLAVGMAPGNAEVRHNLAAMLLASGELTAEAWDLYEARLALGKVAAGIAGLARWRGEDVAGRTVLLHCEQGFGDTIQFARYARLVRARGARVVLAVQPALVRLLQGVADDVVDATAPLPAFDVMCPLLSLPGVFKTALASVPPPLNLARQAPRAGEGLQVGLAWAGSTAFQHDVARSMPLEELLPLAGVAGVTFHSLQVPTSGFGEFPMRDAMAGVQDFADTAAVIARLDLVICVDSAVAHLAGSMGKEVWLLSRHMGCWRWLREREDSPWYPSVRLFRQEAPGDWSGVVARLRLALAARAQGQALPLARAARPRTALDGMELPPNGKRVVLAMLGEDGNGILRSLCGGFMELLRPHGLEPHLVDMRQADWVEHLDRLIARGVLFAWGSAGVGARMARNGRLLWEQAKVPFVSVLADTPCLMPVNHFVDSRWVANGYMCRDWLKLQRRLVRSPQLSAVLPLGTLANPGRARPLRDRRFRMLFVKSGRDPALHRAEWCALPRRFRAVVEDASAAALVAGVGDVTPHVLGALEATGVDMERRTDMLFGLLQAVDGYVRDVRSTSMVRALRGVPADVVGSGWDHVQGPRQRVRFHEAVDASALPGLYAEAQYLLNTMPNFGHGTHERVVSAFAAGSVAVTDENAWMRTQYSGLPSYIPVEANAADLADRLAQLFHATEMPDTTPAAALVAAKHSGESFMRGLVDLALEVASGERFEGLRFSTLA